MEGGGTHKVYFFFGWCVDLVVLFHVVIKHFFIFMFTAMTFNSCASDLVVFVDQIDSDSLCNRFFADTKIFYFTI